MISDHEKIQTADEKKTEEATTKTSAEKKRMEEQRKRLAGRALEYLMFLDDDD